MKRGKPLRANVDQLRAWQRRSQAEALVRQGSKPRRATKRVTQRNDSKWRAECLAARGQRCRVEGCEVTEVQMDHLVERSQGGPSVVENGLPLGDDFHCGHHRAKTEGRLKIRREWMDSDQVDWLEREGHAWWLADGSVAGPRCNTFAPVDHGPAIPDC